MCDDFIAHFDVVWDSEKEYLRNLQLILCCYRQELLAWMNNLLQLNITKVEQCGTGYDLRLSMPTWPIYGRSWRCNRFW